MKVALADVLWSAANVRLWDGTGTYWDYPDECGYTCDCIAVAMGLEGYCDLPEQINEWLRSLGCRSSVESYTFKQRFGDKRQGVRYMWLLLAMHVAEDEKIMIEVTK